MMNLLKSALLVAALSAAMLGHAAAQEQWKLGTVGAPGSGLLRMGEMVAAGMTQAGGDGFSVHVQSIANEQEMVQQVVRGRVEVGVTSGQGLGATAPDASVLAFPFLWDNDKQRDYVMEKHVKPVLTEILAEKGLQLLVIGDAGYYGVFCQFDCQEPASLKDVKVRVSPTPAARLFWSETGANPVQLPLSELWPGLEQNLVRAADIPLPFYVTTPAQKSAPHFINTNHFHAAWVYFMNKRLYDGLTNDQRKAIADSLPTSEELVTLYAADIAAARAKHEELGGTFHELTDEQEVAWRGDIEQKVPELLSQMGPGAQRLYDAITAGKEEFAKTGG
ncbi:TRAP transporter substrate-binding protein DctP [Mesorhizobium sp. KR9-304]|uniref:TRAP transporter substrate-binding protein n=1 Tax=Mesorhizobium sp. KR9-304 TaxID=3156614 RepID=UPI0032B560FD